MIKAVLIIGLLIGHINYINAQQQQLRVETELRVGSPSQFFQYRSISTTYNMSKVSEIDNRYTSNMRVFSTFSLPINNPNLQIGEERYQYTNPLYPKQGYSLIYSNNYSFNLSDIDPDTWVQNWPDAEFLIRYDIPKLSGPETVTLFNCSNGNVILKARYPLPRIPSLIWVWEYKHPQNSTWRELGRVLAADTITFIPSQKFDFPITEETNILFRAKAISVSSEGAYSLSTSITFIPSPSATITPISACAGGVGSINLANIQSSAPNFVYTLLKGSNPAACDPINNPAGCTGDIISSDVILGNNFTINNVDTGTHTLVLSNPGGIYGACHRNYPVTVTRILPLQLDSTTTVDASCAGASDGSISLYTSKGHQSPLTFAINPNMGANTNNGRNAIFDGLPSGTYTVSATDQCGTVVSATKTIQAPVSVTGSFVSQSPDCNNPLNGSVTITANGGSGYYNYTLYKSGVQIAQSSNSANAIYSVNNLPAGNYSFDVRDAQHSACTGYAQSFTLTSLTPLTLSLISSTNVSCFGFNDGAINLNASGGTGSYTFTLTNTATSIQINNTTGIFNNLPAGNYNAIVKKTGLTCNDVAVINNIAITQPQDIVVALIPTDITCNGAGNGSITSAVSGGLGAYTYLWEMQIGTSWSTLSATTPNIINQQEGVYRVKVSDGNGCTQYSSPVTVNEPAELKLISVTPTDITCLGTNGYINMMAQGGNSGYLYEYSSDNGITWNSFANNTTPFNTGTYNLRVKDSKNCMVVASSPVNITAPASALSMNNTVYNYNGYNISCHGANDGSITIIATGGNGATYNGYTYKLDNDTWQAGNVLQHISAGNHIIYAKDARGCIVNNNVTLTQPSSSITVSQSSKTDVDCFGASTGSFTVAASGGVLPYTYKIASGIFQSSPTFNNLPAGIYTADAKDINGCAQSITINIANLNTDIIITSALQQVKCNGGNDGSIQLNVSGGSSPYTYNWTGTTSNTNIASSLQEGQYGVKVIDTKGCNKSYNFNITQPATLNGTLQTKPVCWGTEFGRVTISATGGTIPYQYSSNSGNSWQTDSVFTTLGVGNYPMKVKDANNCITQNKNAVIELRNSKPDLNFLVSTRQNALDTLVIKEVNLPKADSLQWIFDPNAFIINSNNTSPQIKYNAPGSYPVQMTGWFNGCDYSITKNIEIYPYDPTAILYAPTDESIDSLIVYPNPNSGNFTIKVMLNRKQQVAVAFTSSDGKEIYRKEWTSADIVNENIALPAAASSGIYILRVITTSQSKDVKVIIAR